MSDKKFSYQRKIYNPLNYAEEPTHDNKVVPPKVVLIEDDIVCCICDKDKLLVTVDCCKKKICYNCIRKWVKQDKKSCPYCRAEMPIDTETEPLAIPFSDITFEGRVDRLIQRNPRRFSYIQTESDTELDLVSINQLIHETEMDYINQISYYELGRETHGFDTAHRNSIPRGGR